MSRKTFGWKIDYQNTFGTKMEFSTNAFNVQSAFQKLQKHRGGVAKILKSSQIERLRS